MQLINSAEVNSLFSLDVQTLRLSAGLNQQLQKEGCTQLELQISLHLAFHSLCPPQSLWVDLTSPKSSSSTSTSPLVIK